MASTTRTRSLDALLRPASVAVIGASNDPTRIGGRPASLPAGSRLTRERSIPSIRSTGRCRDSRRFREYLGGSRSGRPGDRGGTLPRAWWKRSRRARRAACRVAVIYSAGFAEMGDRGPAACNGDSVSHRRRDRPPHRRSQLSRRLQLGARVLRHVQHDAGGRLSRARAALRSSARAGPTAATCRCWPASGTSTSATG